MAGKTMLRYSPIALALMGGMLGTDNASAQSQGCYADVAGPCALDDTYNVNANATLTVGALGLLDNDIGNTLTVTTFSGATSHGMANVAANGSFTYVPTTGFSGVDSFTYEVTDGNYSANAQVNITVLPVATTDSYNVGCQIGFQNSGWATPDNTAPTCSFSGSSVLANDIGSSLTLASNYASSQRGGDVTLNTQSGTFTYYPVTGEVGADSFTYTATDGTSNVSATVNLNVGYIPNSPASPASTAGNGSLSVAFTGSSNLASNVTYTASCVEYSNDESRIHSSGNSFAGINGFTGTGTSSPVTVSGLTNGTPYICRVKATNIFGQSSWTSYANAATPTAPAESTTPTNPFNPAGNNTSSTVTTTVGTDLGGGNKVTPATSSIISNLSEVNQTTGVSDNGVVVVNAAPGQTIKLVDDAPNGVLFSLPTNQNIPVQVQGRKVEILVNNEVVKGSDGKPLTAVLATRTVVDEQGKSQQVLELVSGQGQIKASEANQIIGALTLSQGGSLRTVTIVDNTGTGGGTTVPGSAGFYKNPNDKSGSVSAEGGAIVLRVILTPEGGTASNRLAAEATKLITLQAGEVARFNAKGELIGVFAGSLSGTLGKTGDPVAVTAPAGLSAYPAKAVKLDGNTLDRLGSNLLPAFAAAIDGTSNFADTGAVTTTATGASTLTQDAVTGIVTAKYQARTDTQFQGLPVGNVTVDPATPDGIVWHTDGSVTWSRQGISVTFVPVSPALTDLAASAKQGGYTAQVLDNGVLKLTGNATYLVGLPRFAATKQGKAAGFAWEAAEQRATFTDNQGYTQIIDPVPYDGSQLDSTVAGMPGWKMSREYFLYGTLRLTGPAGEQFLLTPDYAVSLGKDGSLTGTAYTGTDGRLHYGFKTGFLPFAQGFGVK